MAKRKPRNDTTTDQAIIRADYCVRKYLIATATRDGQMRTISDMTRLTNVGRDTIMQWVKVYSEHFSDSAQPHLGRTRYFNEDDCRACLLIAEFWEENPDVEHIRIMLNCGNHHEMRYSKEIRLNTEIFQEVPEEIDETWRHGVLLSNMYIRPSIEVARSYKYAADQLTNEALSSSEPQHLDYPIFFTYRHTLELYLKLVLDDQVQAKEISHSLGGLICAVEKKLGGQMSEWTKSRLHEFDDMDPTSDLFRYSDRAPQHRKNIDCWVDLHQLKTVMGQLCEAFEAHLTKHTVS